MYCIFQKRNLQNFPWNIPFYRLRFSHKKTPDLSSSNRDSREKIVDLVLFPAKDADLPTDVEAMDHTFEALQVKDPQREINTFGMTKARIQPLNLGSTTSSRCTTTLR